MEPIKNDIGDLVTRTSLPNDRTNAEVTQTGAKREIRLKGPLSEILRRALDIIYDKDSEYEGNYSMENAPIEVEQESGFDELLYVVVDADVNEQVIAHFSELVVAAKEEHKPISLMVLGSKDSEGSDLLESLLAIASGSGATVIDKPDDYFN